MDVGTLSLLKRVMELRHVENEIRQTFIFDAWTGIELLKKFKYTWLRLQKNQTLLY